jgi:hypothetical protein
MEEGVVGAIFLNCSISDHRQNWRRTREILNIEIRCSDLADTSRCRSAGCKNANNCELHFSVQNSNSSRSALLMSAPTAMRGADPAFRWRCAECNGDTFELPKNDALPQAQGKLN